MSALLEADGLVKDFALKREGVFRARRHVRAVDGVSLSLSAGETLGVVGESGCGKSTLSRMLVRLADPTSGSLRLDGQDLLGMGRRELRTARRRIQMVFQDPYGSLDPRMTVGDIVAEPLRAHRVPFQASADRVVGGLLEQVGLSGDHVNRFPHEFSGGQRQRIAIARALALKPDVLVLDEPVSALDVSTQANVINLLLDLQKELGLAYVFIAHNLAVVRQIADRVAVMYLGRFVETGTADAIYGAPSHPYTRALLDSVPVADPDDRSPEGPTPLAGDPPSPIGSDPACSFRSRCRFATAECSTAPLLHVRTTGHAVACHHPVGGSVEATL